MARLVELEAAHLLVSRAPADSAPAITRIDAARPSSPPTDGAAGHVEPRVGPKIETNPAESSEKPPASLWHRLTATRRRRVGYAAGAIAIIAILIYTAVWIFVPRPDATLTAISVETDGGVMEVLTAQGGNPEASTLRQFEAYNGVDVWSVENRGGNLCLVAWDSTRSGRFDVQCVPPGVQPAVHLGVGSEDTDGFGDWLPEGSRISLYLRDNTVDVFLYAPTAAD